MTKNVTLRLDEEILIRCRYEAVEAGVSLSQWIADTVSEKVGARQFQEALRKHALSILDSGISLGGEPLGREEAHGS
ncbi:MAG TPA: hypothetical protein VMV83_17970 [Rectinemataceae bacterium]|nr:hypothetical protein [Rectinemataceae bacterium]